MLYKCSEAFFNQQHSLYIILITMILKKVRKLFLLVVSLHVACHKLFWNGLVCLGFAYV